MLRLPARASQRAGFWKGVRQTCFNQLKHAGTKDEITQAAMKTFAAAAKAFNLRATYSSKTPHPLRKVLGSAYPVFLKPHKLQWRLPGIQVYSNTQQPP
jgi:hypothetical protein